MTAQNRATLKLSFENGDVPQGSDYANLIDSAINTVDTTAQSLASDLTVVTLIATEASAARGHFTDLTATSANFTRSTVTEFTATSAIFARVTAVNLFAASANFTNSTVTNFVGTSATITNLVGTSASFSALALTVATTTKASGGTGGAVPASAQGFLEVNVGGTIRYIPFFNVK